MDLNEYLAVWLVRERLAEARACAARKALLDACRPARRKVRVSLGLALIKFGQWLLGHASEDAGEPDRLARSRESGRH